MKAAMLVGGFGTRLRPLTITTPKPMLPLVNIPFLETELLHLKKHGIDEVVLSTGYLPAIFDEYFRDGEHLGMKLIHVTEDEPLGTCGAIRNVRDHLGGEPVVVCNGDILTNLDIGALVEFHNSRAAAITIALTPVEDPTAYGLVPLHDDGRIMEFLEKPSWNQVTTNMINAGTYVMDPCLLDAIPCGENYSFERQLFPDLLEAGVPMYGYPSDAYWLDLGTPEKYLAAHYDILDGRVEVPLKGEADEDSVFLGNNVSIAPEARLFGPVIIGDHSTVSGNAEVGEKSSIGSGVVIGSGSRVTGSVILDGVTIGEDCLIEGSIIGKGTTLGADVHVADLSVLGDDVHSGSANEFRKGIRIWPSTVIESGKIKF